MAPVVAPARGAAAFNPADFAWSEGQGPGQLAGHLAYGGGGYTCSGAEVILTPETAWTRARMQALYGSVDYAAVDPQVVRARTAQQPTAEYSAFVRKAVCDANNRFSWRGLPVGRWYVITLARPANGGGAMVAVMRRVETTPALVGMEL